MIIENDDGSTLNTHRDINLRVQQAAEEQRQRAELDREYALHFPYALLRVNFHRWQVIKREGIVKPPMQSLPHQSFEIITVPLIYAEALAELERLNRKEAK